VFGWAVAFEKAAVSCGLWKSSCEKAAVGKAEGRLVRGAVKLQAVCDIIVMPLVTYGYFGMKKYKFSPSK
jgi:hypothetical protein